MFQSNAAYLVRLALTDQYSSASPVMLSGATCGGCKGLVFELPSEYTCNSKESSSQTQAYGFISHVSKDQWHCVELEENGRIRISTIPEQSSSDDMTLGWRVLFQVGAIVEKKRIEQRPTGHCDFRDMSLFRL